MNPFVPLIFLILGAIVTAGGALAPNWLQRGLVSLTPVGATLLALLAQLALGLRLPVEVTFSAWGPGTLFQAGLILRADQITWLFSTAILFAALAAFLTGLTRPGGPRLGPRTGSLLITTAALAAIQAQNLITLAVTWTALDIIYFVCLMLLARGERLEAQAVLSLAFNTAATFLVVAAALNVLNSGQRLFIIGESPLTSRAVLLLLLAVVFRLGVFPFHLSLPAEANIRQGLGTLLRLAPAAVALSLLAHVIAVAERLPLVPWLSAAAALGLLVGALQWWDTPDPRQGLSFVVLAHSSLALLAALNGGQAAGVGVLAFGLALILGGAALFLHNGYHESEKGWLAASISGALVLAGLPITVGFVAAATLYQALAVSGSWILLVVCVIGQLLLAASYVRLIFWPGEEMSKGEPALGVAYLFGLALPVLFAVVTGLATGALTKAFGASIPGLLSSENLTGLGAVLAAAIGGVGLWQFENVIRGRAERAWGSVTSAARLDWLYIAFWEVYRTFGRTLRTAADIVEGEGGVLWTIVVALLVWLLFRNR
jgi:formate hydrogenlyase subunit 3/multisubunit Na+/H+ antiporter MnhD subunit